MKKFLKEFKEFASRGNVFDMAVGVILATAFGKITASLINDVLMPFIGWIFGGVDLSMLNIVLRTRPCLCGPRRKSLLTHPRRPPRKSC